MRARLSRIFLLLVLSFPMAAPVAHTAQFCRINAGFWSGTGRGDTFSGTYGVAADNQGHFYVVDRFNDRVVKFTTGGAFVREWGSHGTADGQFFYPTTIDIDADGNVYVVDCQNNRIQKFDADGHHILSWGSSGAGSGQFAGPRGLAIFGTEVFVADTENHRMQVFTRNGAFLREWGSPGTGDGQFNRPFDVGFNPAGILFVLDADNRRVQKFSGDGTYLGQWRGPSGKEFLAPNGIAVDDSGHVLVVNAGLQLQMVFTESGELLADWYQSSGGDAAFSRTGELYETAINLVIQSTVVPCYTPPPEPVAHPRILLHVQSTMEKNACSTFYMSCQYVNTRGVLSGPSGPFQYVYLLVDRDILRQVGGVQCGITYETGSPGDMENGSGVDVFSWTACGTAEFPTPGPNAWPRPEGGNLITWAEGSCGYDPLVLAGYFYVGAYTPDEMKVIPRPVDGLAKIADCEGDESIVVDAGQCGSVAFSAGGLSEGCNPCTVTDCLLAVPVIPSTWSGIKTLLRDR